MDNYLILIDKFSTDMGIERNNPSFTYILPYYHFS